VNQTFHSAAHSLIDDLSQSLPAEAAALKSAAQAYEQGFVERCSACADDTLLFAIKQTLKTLKAFSVREFDRRIKDERMKLNPAAKTNGHAPGGWKELLIKSERGTVLPILANAITTLRYAPEWQDRVGFNEFSSRIELLKPAPWRGTGNWTDADDILLADWLQHEGLRVGPDIASHAALAASRSKIFHPVRNWLNSLAWDGIYRVGRFLPDYYGSESTDYTLTIGQKWLISAIARIMEPGCQADHCLIFESDQGIRKSTSLRLLAGGDEWFTDHISSLDMAQASQDLQGKWIIEFADLVRMGTTEANTLKNFITRRSDHFRPPYGRRVADFNRQCVFAATTNDSTYLNDPTGARRFWPVECHNIDLESLRRDVDQIWAESLSLYRDKQTWWIEDPETIDLARTEQSGRFISDSWDQPVWTFVSAAKKLWVSDDEFWVQPESILREGLKKVDGSWTPGEKTRVSKVLKSHGMERYREWLKDYDGNPLLGADGKPESRYIYRFKPPKIKP
jgi:predicted P-loop ATPase